MKVCASTHDHSAQMRIILLFGNFFAFYQIIGRGQFYTNQGDRAAQKLYVKIGNLPYIQGPSLEYSFCISLANNKSYQQVSCSRRACEHTHNGSSRGLWTCWRKKMSYIDICRKLLDVLSLSKVLISFKMFHGLILAIFSPNLKSLIINRTFKVGEFHRLMLAKIKGYLIQMEWVVVDNCALLPHLLILGYLENSYKSFSRLVALSQFAKRRQVVQKSEKRRTILLVEHLDSLEIDIPHI